MTRKLRFKWPDQNERTISDIVENDGTMRSREVLYIIEKLCTLLRTPDKGNKESAWNSETAGFAAPAAGSDPAELTAAASLSDPAESADPAAVPDPAELTAADLSDAAYVPDSAELAAAALPDVAYVPDPAESADPAALSDSAGPASAFTYSDSAKGILQNRQILQPYRTLPAPHLLSRIRIVRKVRSIRAIPRLKPGVLHTYIRTAYW